MRKKRYIVTGGAGFIGSHMATRLLNVAGAEVIVLDDLSTGFMENLPEHKDLTFVHVDVSNWEDLSRNFNYFRDVDGIFHFAAMARIQPGIHNPLLAHVPNVNGTFNLLEMMRMMNIKNIVYSASSSSYGLKNELPCVETQSPDCLNPYALTKYIGEQYCKTWGKIYGINNVCLKYFNVYGERSPLEGSYAPVIGLFFRQGIKSGELTIIGDGEQRRDFTHVDDVVSANVLAMDKCSQASGETFNIGTGKNYSINELAALVQKCLLMYGTKTKVKHIPARPGESRETLANIDKARDVLGWIPQADLEKELDKLVLHYRHVVR